MNDEETIFIIEKEMEELILKNLFSEETEKFYANCEFPSNRMAFMQGMNYAALLCAARLEKFPAILRREGNINDE